MVKTVYPFLIRSLYRGTPMDQAFHYIFILDFEATCLKDMRLKPQEIIEFPCVKFNTKTLEVESTFQSYVQPIFNPKLSPFCIKLTGISQEKVDAAPQFPEVKFNSAVFLLVFVC